MTPYYESGGITIYRGDALEILPTIDEVSCVVLDPPYSMIPNARGGRDDGAAGTSGAPVRLLTETLKHTRRLLAPGGVAPLVCDWRRVPDVSYLATLVGLRISTCLAWTRSKFGLGGIFRSAWDPVLILSVGIPTVRNANAVPNVIHAEKPRDSDHPYEKPTALWEHILGRIPSGTVLDPYSGTGASLVAAIHSGHRAIGIEIEERYCEIAARRLDREVLDLGGAA